MSKVRRIFVEKKPDYAVKAKELHEEITNYLGIKAKGVRILIRYDIENLTEETYQKAIGMVFSEPPIDIVYEETNVPCKKGDFSFSVEYLPGQFDQRADSAEQCVKLLNETQEPVIKTAITYIIESVLSQKDKEKIIQYCINPIDSRMADEKLSDTLIIKYEEPKDIVILNGFQGMKENQLKELYDSLGLAMTFQDFLHIQNQYKKKEKRSPSMTEIRVFDTYWSDHCRHTTFLTKLTNVDFEEGYYKSVIEDTYNQYINDRTVIYKAQDDKPICLMDIALMAMKKLRAEGNLSDMEISEEINACSIVVPVQVDYRTEEWIISFKNETHNHPTEIEPFGGAATCLGGAIRDPLSGRSYVYQAMRVTGASDPTVSLGKTMSGKLPQRKIVTEAAKGYSSYGNQIGLATGLVDEIYHPNYVAKRLEIGAVIGAAPRKQVKRLSPVPGDQIILLGGRTGRDGCGGATGSSKAHTLESIDTCGAEVQKGNPPTERKIQRLFMRREVASLIKKCNDFGAGGVSVAIGELADGLLIDLDKIPKKYIGLDGTELAISESQERMAIVVDAEDVEAMLSYAAEENLEAVVVAEVMKVPRLVMTWRGKKIVNISRAFLDTNGAIQEAQVRVAMPDEKEKAFHFNQTNTIQDVKETWLSVLKDLNVCSKKGLVEMFDSSIGAASVFMPYGGKYQRTPIQTMVAKLPVQKGTTDAVTMMSYGFDPYLSTWSPYHGAIYAVIHSVAKILAAGGDWRTIRFTFQEYFKRLGEDETRWGEPLAALLGAYSVQVGLGLPSIGGKDSMSGTFQDIDVPPTLCSFAVNVGSHKHLLSPEFKGVNHPVIKISIKKDEYGMPDYKDMMKTYTALYKDIKDGKILSAYAIGFGGIVEAISKMGFGNGIGAVVDASVTAKELLAKDYGAIIAEIEIEELPHLTVTSKMIARTTKANTFNYEDIDITVDEAYAAWASKLESVFPTSSGVEQKKLETKLYDTKDVYICEQKIARPKVFIPVFPGTNCEYDLTKAFTTAGANVETTVFKNLSTQDIQDSVEAFREKIEQSQMIMFPGGFSAGDEPEGSAKFFAAAFRNEVIKEEVMKLLNERDGLMLGICNGFQALIKLGLLPHGEIMSPDVDSLTLTMNSIGRLQSKMVYTKVVSNKSPWFMKAELGGVYAMPASHGEGRFVASDEWIQKLFKNGQIATQYVDLEGNPTMDENYNINGSYHAIEGITSPDGRVFGKMAHSERIGEAVAMNIIGNQNQMIFESGVAYFR